MSSDSATRILYVSHGHPAINPGGGEIAAYNLFNEVNATKGYEACFLARHDKQPRVHGGTTFSGTGVSNEILFYAPMAEWFQFSQPDKPKVWRDFRETLELYKPDVVHFHHYVHLGLEMIREVKNYDPDLPVILTLHEYFGICHNHGQMVKATDGSLCHGSSPAECSQCFPKHSPQDFFLRKQFIHSFFSLVDQFLSPSEFLRERYIQWGIPADKIKVIENVDLSDSNDRNMSSEPASPVTADKTGRAVENVRTQKIRFSFFGQINWFKGIDVVLDSLSYLPAKVRKNVTININGSGLENQPEEMRKYVKSVVEQSAGTIRLRGKYERRELPSLMNDTDWVIIPSKWWENSPMVILEANKYGVPVLCSNIGGMAEKVQHGVTGLHFQVGRADSLAEQIEWIVKNPQAWKDFSQQCKNSFNSERDFEEHLAVYSSLVENRDNNSDGSDKSQEASSSLRAA